MKHAKLGASNSEIWLNCPGAPKAWETAPPKKESKYAQEGTEAHSLLQKWLEHYKTKRKNSFYNPLIGTDLRTIRAVKFCVDDLKKTWKPSDKNKELIIEKKVYLKSVDPSGEMHGTVDLGVAELFGTLHVTDYKHGSGVKVEVVKESASGMQVLNTQLVYYALGLAEEYHFNFEDVVLKIVQPRHTMGDPISEARISIDELTNYIEYFKDGVKRTKDKNAKRTPGAWCRFCQAKPVCKESKQGVTYSSRDDFD